MNDAARTRPASPLDPRADTSWETCRVLVPVDEIGYIVAIFEAYDNHFLVRTETQGLGYLRLWYPAENRRLLGEIIAEMRTEFPIDILEYSPGMSGLDEVFPE